jgi:hypothetical protein
MTDRLWLFAGVAAAATAATGSAARGQAQVNATVTYSLTWNEVSAVAPYAPVATPNGQIDPGEGARFAITATISPAPGSPISFSPTLLAGSSGSGFVGGFGLADLSLTATGVGSQGTWIVSANSTPSTNPNRLGVLPPFNAGNMNGTPSSTGVANLQPAQFGADVTFFNSASPTPTMWRGLWVPSGAPWQATFTLGDGGLGIGTSIFIRDSNGLQLPIYARANVVYDSVYISIPAPAGVPLLGLPFVFRRRRESNLTRRRRQRQ